MFSKGNKENQETKTSNNPKVDDFMMPSSQKIENKPAINPLSPPKNQTDIEQSQLVKLVEKISGILSPYFIVIVGLYLYDNNFFFGSILILIGMLSLLKISYEDIWQGIEKIKDFFKNQTNS